MTLLAAAGVARAETWRLHAAIGNDAFTEVIPPLPDDGFTNDLVLDVRRVEDDLAIGGSIMHRMITSLYDHRRWDQLDLIGTADYALDPHVTASVRLGPTFGGNFGGLAMQNWWHGFSHTGPTIDQGLPNRYPGDRRVGVIAGGRTRAAIGDDVQAYGVVDAQLALAAGVSWIETAAGGAARTRVGSTLLGAHLEIAIARYHVADPNLALPGGYGTGWQLIWRLGVDVAWGRNRLAYEYRANEGGSGQPIGVIAFDRTF